ncbi:hypothetical protein PV10_06357 [Exophiala mesophila]|uniref:Uncharacterized protein n=1 Tax=Exophiala mesophila TaxID=212818 RepID=A0A0D1XUI2_EXOME|nr:uncharacterized protein PV10_06357 [Exophiala mesophila]KIV91866.1 hypothetical protein PV10_06357 [Exophiala mesophila]
MSHLPGHHSSSDHDHYSHAVEGDRTQAGHEHTSLYHEIHETVRRLLQHLVFVSLLSLRLYMLPLLYISHKLAVSDDPWYLATWSTMLRPGRSLADCDQCKGGPGGLSLMELWFNMRENVRTPLRIFKTLYALGRAIGEDPNTIHPTPQPLLSLGPDSAIDVESLHDESVKPCATESTETIDAPASASEIYHAALLNGDTLDDILAAFGDRPPSLPQSTDLTEAQGSPQSARNNDDCLTGPFRRRSYRRSITHITPERNTDNEVRTPATTIKDTERHVTLSAKSPVEKPAPEWPCEENKPPAVSCVPSGHPQEEACGHPIKHCPTFERRHHLYSNGSKRPLSVDRHPLGYLQDRGMMSTPALASTSPTKRARLQRRVKVFNDADKA